MSTKIGMNNDLNKKIETLPLLLSNALSLKQNKRTQHSLSGISAKQNRKKNIANIFII